MIGGIDKPTKGRVIIDGEDLSKMDDKALTIFHRHKIGFVFQFFNLIPTLTAIENIEFSLNLRGIKGKKAREEAVRYLSLVGLSSLKDRFPSELSGGE